MRREIRAKNRKSPSEQRRAFLANWKAGKRNSETELNNLKQSNMVFADKMLQWHWTGRGAETSLRKYRESSADLWAATLNTLSYGMPLDEYQQLLSTNKDGVVTPYTAQQTINSLVDSGREGLVESHRKPHLQDVRILVSGPGPSLASRVPLTDLPLNAASYSDKGEVTEVDVTKVKEHYAKKYPEYIGLKGFRFVQRGGVNLNLLVDAFEVTGEKELLKVLYSHPFYTNQILTNDE